MSSYFTQPREIFTTMPCPACGGPLTAKRHCRKVTLDCPACRKEYAVEERLKDMDEALEGFLDGVYLDRI